MDVFQVHQQLLADYEAFTAGFIKIHDPRIRKHVDQRVANRDQWPDAYLSLNPNFASGGSITELVKHGFLHPECEQIFRVGKEEPPAALGQVIDLHQHQRDAVEIGDELLAGHGQKRWPQAGAGARSLRVRRPTAHPWPTGPFGRPVDCLSACRRLSSSSWGLPPSFLHTVSSSPILSLGSDVPGQHLVEHTHGFLTSLTEGL
ncbi:MAG: hypothetical protein ACRDTH_07485 [Pseudonocardiaceae bacterium]